MGCATDAGAQGKRKVPCRGSAPRPKSDCRGAEVGLYGPGIGDYPQRFLTSDWPAGHFRILLLIKSQIALYAQRNDNAEPHPSETWRDVADLAVAPLLSRCFGR